MLSLLQLDMTHQVACMCCPLLQAIMKAGGGCALFVAMTAVLRARHMLKTVHHMDVMMVPQWITEDTTTTLGRESKFLQFTLLPSGLHGVLPAAQQATRQPAIAMIQPPATEAATPAAASSQ